MRRHSSPHDDEPAAENPKAVESAAVRLLARREHSTEQLRRKLLQKGHDAATIDLVLEKLTAKRLLADARFAASLVRHSVQRGQGPVRIRADLRQQGVPAETIEEQCSAAAVDWAQLAAQVRRRRFGPHAPRTLGERAKQARFLQYRGFSAEQIRAALKSDPEAPPEIAEADMGESDLDVSDFDADADAR